MDERPSFAVPLIALAIVGIIVAVFVMTKPKAKTPRERVPFRVDAISTGRK